MNPDRLARPESLPVGSPARLCVLFDASVGSLAALELAMTHRRSGQPLEALFLDEPDWQRSAAYAFTTEVCALSGHLRPHHAQSARWRQQARQARAQRALRQRLETTDLKICAVAELEQRMAEFGPEDWLALGRVGFADQQGRRLGSLARQLVEQSQASLLLAAARPQPGPRCLAVLLDTPDHPTALVQRARARAFALGLSLLLIGETALDTFGSDNQVDRVACYRPSYPTGLAGQTELARLIRARRVGELWLSRRGRWLASPDGLARLAALPVALSVVA